ncbi:hypothetical protein [Streptomyces marincola]|uniref:Secreted protein n=1 Tax=Streptomyces marincola TaxID=2878388 RepID=A0A1W7CVP8_9ACTN|nr:hypothetical protein [Streptomyces marincola]ARQ68858.1 hypothetical protein CAG99_08280 [Streptomyces marincola]
MDLRENKSRLILIVVALGAALVIAVASCGGGGGGDDGDARGSGETADATPDDGGNAEAGEGEGGDGPDDADEEPAELLAEVTGEESITLGITRAEREAGGFLTVEGTITNNGSDRWFTTRWAGPEQELADNGFSMAGASIVANEEGKRYLILRDTTGRCLCTGFGTGIEAGATVPWFAQFPEPEAGTTEVSFQVGNMPPATIQIR